MLELYSGFFFWVGILKLLWYKGRSSEEYLIISITTPIAINIRRIRFERPEARDKAL